MTSDPLTTMVLYRALIKTHHILSRKKVTTITKAAKKFNCAVYLKTGAPGIMLGECDGEQGQQDLKEWVASVKVGHLQQHRSFTRIRCVWHSLKLRFSMELATQVQRLQASTLGSCGARSVAGQEW